MQELSHKERAYLASLRICDVHEPRLSVDCPIPRTGRRVLVPFALCHLFAEITAPAETMTTYNLRETVELLARGKLGTVYRREALPIDAPNAYSCSTFVKALFAFIGIDLPRYAIDQSYVGNYLYNSRQSCLVFSAHQFPIKDQDRSVSHVGLVTQHRTIIHGSSTQRCVVEEPFNDEPCFFVDIIPDELSLLLYVPDHIQGVETALDLARWLQRPPLHCVTSLAICK